jgi:Fic family protein
MPRVVKEDTDPAYFEYITNRNLLWQYDFLIDSIRLDLELGRKHESGLTGGFLLSLNHFAVVNLTPRPGQLRNDHVHIRNSPHEPPVEWLARELFFKMPGEISADWNAADPIELAARVLWRLSWIHPFEEGNGRTSRAACYYVLSVKFGFLLPGRKTILQLIREDKQPYYRALRHADDTLAASGEADLKPLVGYLNKMLIAQLQS